MKEKPLASVHQVPQMMTQRTSQMPYFFSRLVERDPIYLAIGALSFLVVIILERLAAGLEGILLTTEIYSIHDFSHVFFGIGLASTVLFLRPRATARAVILGVQKRGLRWWGLYAWETGIHAVRTGVFCVMQADPRQVRTCSSNIFLRCLCVSVGAGGARTSFGGILNLLSVVP